MVNGFVLVSDNEISQPELEVTKKLLEGLEIEFVNFEDIVPVAGEDKEIIINNEKVDCPDFVFVRAFNLGNRKYHLRSVLDMFERMGVNCINPNMPRQITTDKLLSLQKAKEIIPELKVPKTLLVTPNLSLDTIEEELGFPLVIKINHGSEGRGVSLIESKKELKNLLNVLFASPYDDQVLAQEAIMTSKGRDLRIIVIGGEFFHSVIRSNESSFTSNVHTGGDIKECNPPEKLINQAIKILDGINIKYGSVDFLFGENEDEYYLCEINSMPGLGFADLVDNKEVLTKLKKCFLKVISK